MSLPGWPQVPPVRKEKPRGRWRPAEISPAIRSRQEGRPYTATSGSCDLSGGITETPLLRPHQSKSFFPGALTESRASGTGSSLRQTRPTLGIVTSEEHSERISALSLRPTRGGGAKRRALCLCVISGKSIGDNGNMALNGAEVDDFSWEPPTEAETKVLQARRERQDRISRLMGDYLLRGYRMLGETCADCGTILLQDKQRKIYCVACQELDSDVDKDNPALNAQAALSQAREHQLASASEPPLGSRPAPQPPVPRPEHCEGAAAGLKAVQGPPPPAVPPNAEVVACTREALLQKLAWASAELGSSTSLETSIQLCSLIRACAEALRSLQQLQP
uniref:Sjoegren syndrome/scleroderma autoantigen 1 n=4 Tax=Suina TaxID=35497 RepID=A0A8D1LJI6_PIG